MNEVEKITNFQKIKSMDIDEMAELFKQIAYKLLKQTADIVNNSLGKKRLMYQ